jgi:hypothetical protein
MKSVDLMALLSRLAKATKNQPTADDIDILSECIIDNRLTDDEIRMGYQASRDASEPWWPKPGEFLSRARPSTSKPATATLHRTEAELIFQSILDNPQLYGPYNPHTGRVYQRRMVEGRHGKAAGIAFAAIATRLPHMNREDPASVTFTRKEFVDAYDAARMEYPAPPPIPPSRQLPARPAPKLEPFRVEPGAYIPTPTPEKVKTELDFDARKAELLRQAEELKAEAK